MRRITTGGALLAMALSLAACGHRPGDRALSGGLIGAGGGAAVAAMTGGGAAVAAMTGGAPLVGAAIGGAAGALGGALTSPGAVNLGKPAWR